MGKDKDRDWKSRLRFRRRQLLHALGISSVSSLAGCPSVDNDEEEPGTTTGPGGTTDVLISDGGQVRTTATSIDGNIVTATLRNGGDESLTLPTVEIEATEKQSELTGISSQQVSVLQDITTFEGEATEILNKEHVEVVEDLDIEGETALTSANLDSNAEEAISEITPAWKNVVCDISADTRVVQEITATTKDGQDVVADTIKIIEHVKEFAEGHIQEIVAEVAVKVFGKEEKKPITDINVNRTNVVGDGDWEIGEGEDGAITSLETASTEFLTNVNLTTGGEEFVKMQGYPFGGMISRVDVVSLLETESTPVITDILRHPINVIQTIQAQAADRTVTTKSVWEAEGVAGEPVTVEPGAEKTFEFDFTQERALLAGIAPSNIERIDGLEDADIVEKWLYDGAGNERMHALLQPLAG